ncbi:MAG: hypothetical protein BGP03_33940 [Pseudonocardia sp. 73-21]|nr:MAG: hypothetical protein BGP03_33940 [Pseudonocardia sp. 73-21]
MGDPVAGYRPRVIDPVDRHVLRAFAIARTTGAPALACLAGVGATPEGTFGLTGAPDGWTAPVGLLEIAVLADLALGAAARAEAGSDRRMPTLGLTIDLAGGLPPAARLTVAADEPAIDDGFVSTAGTVRDGDRAVGHCAATFALGSAGFAVLPWELRDAASVDPLAEPDLDAAETGMLAAVRAATGSSWSDAVLDDAIRDGRLHASPLLANRAGTVQGGVLFALAARAAASAVDGPVRMRGGHLDFLSAGDVAHPLDTTSTLLGAGRRTSFARAEISQDGRLVAVGSFVQHAG